MEQLNPNHFPGPEKASKPQPQKRSNRVPPTRDALIARLRAADALLNFKPSPVQDAFLRSPSPHRALIGGNRAGKTLANAADLAYIARGLHPYRRISRRLRILVLTNTRQQAASVFGRKLFAASELPGKYHDTPLIPPDEVQVEYLKVGVHVPYSASTKYADILFSWSAADNVWERLQGLKLDLAYFDEDAGTTKLVDEMFMRGLDARSSGEAPWLGGISWSATPTTSTDGYVKFREYCKTHNPATSYFFIPAGDNPAISKLALDDARQFLGAKQAQMRVEGTKDATDLVLIYGEQWKDERHIAAEPLPEHPRQNLWLGYDPGVDHPTGMVLAALREDGLPGELRIIKSWLHARQTLEFDARVLDEYLRGRKLCGVVYDYAAKIQTKMGSSVITEFMSILARKNMQPLFGYFQAKKIRESGIAMVRHYLDPDPYDPTAPPLLRLDPPTLENGVGAVKQQFLAYRGKESTRFTGEGGVVKKDDDLMDALRYLIMHRAQWVPEGVCGLPTKEQPNADAAPIEKPLPPPTPDLDPYARHIAMSRQRRRAGVDTWTEVDF